MLSNFNHFLDKEFKNWDSDKFNWKDNSWELCAFCYNYFEIWWDTDKFDWEGYSWALAINCSKYIHIWWDPDKVDWMTSYELVRYCSKYKSVWYKDYLIHKLSL